MTFSEFIEQKEHRPLALVMKVEEATIRSWKRRNHIPRDRWDRLIEVFPSLTYAKLRDMAIESASK